MRSLPASPALRVLIIATMTLAFLLADAIWLLPKVASDSDLFFGSDLIRQVLKFGNLGAIALCFGWSFVSIYQSRGEPWFAEAKVLLAAVLAFSVTALVLLVFLGFYVNLVGS